jgi:hypothetical protein
MCVYVWVGCGGFKKNKVRKSQHRRGHVCLWLDYIVLTSWQRRRRRRGRGRGGGRRRCPLPPR